jgi:RNA polymerase sigma-70 factor (ECF subfamily)
LKERVICEDAIPQVTAGDTAEPDALLMDEKAFAAFHQRTARAVWAYLARASGDAALADDLLQESYLRFLGARPRKDDEETRRRYLFGIATNLLRDHWRRPQTAALEEVPEAALIAADRRDAERMDSQALLGPAFARMKARERQLLWLAYAEGCTHREIAHITGLRVTSIRILLFRAKNRLARLLRETALEPGRKT